MMEPSKCPSSHAEGYWSEMLESLRKDVECVFGQMKNMFAILKYGSRDRSMSVVDNTFLACAAIFNQRKMALSLDVTWADTDISMDDEDNDLHSLRLRQRMDAIALEDERIEQEANLRESQRERDDEALFDGTLQNVERFDEALSHGTLRDSLIKSFNVQLEMKKVHWPSREGKRLFLKREDRISNK